MTIRVSYLFFLVWCLSTTPLFLLAQEEVAIDNIPPCETLCEGYYKRVKELWKKDNTDSIYRYKTFANGNRIEKGQFLKTIYNYPQCCIDGQSKSMIISLLGKPDAILSDKTTFSFFYFVKKSTYNEYLEIKDELFKPNKELWAVKVSFDCKTKKTIKMEFK